MDIRCPQCETLYEFDESRVKSGSATLKCRKCQHMFRLGTDAQPSREDQQRWMVRDPREGDILYFNSFETLHRWIVEREVDQGWEISRTGDKWKTLGDVGEFRPIFQVVDNVSTLEAENEQEQGTSEKAPERNARTKKNTLDQFNSQGDASESGGGAAVSAQAPEDESGAADPDTEEQFPVGQESSGAEADTSESNTGDQFPVAQESAGAEPSSPAETEPAARTPSGAQSPVQTPSGGQQAAQTPSGGQQPAQTPSGGQQAAQTPSGGQQAAQTPSGGEQTTQTPSGGQQAAQTPSGGQHVSQQTPSGGQQAAQTPSGGQQAAQTPSGGHTPPEAAESGSHQRQRSPSPGPSPAAESTEEPTERSDVQLDSGMFGSQSSQEGESGSGGDEPQDEWAFGDEEVGYDDTTIREEGAIDYQPGGGRRWPMIVAAAAVVLGGAGAYFWFFQRDTVDSWLAAGNSKKAVDIAESSESGGALEAGRSQLREVVSAAANRAREKSIEQIGAARGQAGKTLTGALDKATKKAKKKAEENKKVSTTDLLSSAQRALENGNAPTARRKFHKIIEREPRNSEAITGLGWSLINIGRTGAAIAQFEKALHYNPSYGDAYIGLGQANQAKGNSRAALEAYKEYLKRFPGGSQRSIAEYQAKKIKKSVGIE